MTESSAPSFVPADHGYAGAESAPPPVAGPEGQQIHFAPSHDRITRLVDRVRGRTPVWLGPLAALGCIGAALGYTVWADPAASNAESTPGCLVKLLTGFDCPGCGGTRAAWYLMHGDVAAASRHHMLFVFAVPFLIYLYVAWAGRTVFGWRLPQLQLSPQLLAWFLGAWGVFTILRNLPWEPFTYFFV